MTPSRWKVSMLIYAIISLLSLGRADTFPENWKIHRRFLLFLFRSVTISDCRKNAIAHVIQGLLSLFLSLTSFNSVFGHFLRDGYAINVPLICLSDHHCWLVYCSY